MIAFEKYRGKLIPADLAAHLQKIDDDRRKRRDRAGRARIRASALALGLDPAEVLKIDPGEALRIFSQSMRDKISPEELARRYPCRSCSVAHDETYRSVSLAAGQAPCFVDKSMRGCGAWQPKAIVA